MTSTVTAPKPDASHKHASVVSDRTKAENRLGQKLVLPAIVLMLIVTAFPMLRAIWLSVYDYSLAAPDDRDIVWFQNYLTALTDWLFWKTTIITVVYMVVTVAIELVLPAIVLMLIVTAFPMLRAIWLSVYDYSLAAPDDRDVVWFQNYLTALSDPLFWKTTGITVAYMVVTVAIELVIGFAFAMVMHRLIFARGVVRTSILIPYGIITVVSGFAWQFAFSSTNGFVNGWIPGIEDSFNWFGDTTPAVIAICISEIWKTTPFMSLLLLAGLAQVSEDMIEAAKVDGATWWQRLWKVILPNMRAAIMVAVLFRALDAYRIFDNIFVMTNGAEDTASISFLTYRQTIEQLQLGMGSALSVLLFLSVLLIAWLIIKLFRVDLAQARQES